MDTVFLNWCTLFSDCCRWRLINSSGSSDGGNLTASVWKYCKFRFIQKTLSERKRIFQFQYRRPLNNNVSFVHVSICVNVSLEKEKSKRKSSVWSLMCVFCTRVQATPNASVLFFVADANVCLQSTRAFLLFTQFFFERILVYRHLEVFRNECFFIHSHADRRLYANQCKIQSDVNIWQLFRFAPSPPRMLTLLATISIFSVSYF